MNDETIVAATPLVLVMAFTGGAFGLVYFAALRRTVALLATGSGWASPLLFTLCRIIGAVAFLTLAAKLGAAPLLAAFLGFLVARAIAVRVVREAG